MAISVYKQHAYSAIPLATSWTTAEALSEAVGGHLVSITSAGEEAFVKSVIPGGGDYWIGLTGSASSGFKWVTGEALAYTDWARGQPSGVLGGNAYVTANNHGAWNDQDNVATNDPLKGFVVEFDNGQLYKSVVVANAQTPVATGTSGNDLLLGFGDNLTLKGGAGDDTYYITSPSTQVIEVAGGGTDTVISTVSYRLGNAVENLTLTGTANIDATGNELDNILIGNSGNNVLNGGGGNDTLIGGAGNDTYYVNNTGTQVVELPGGGTDTVISSVSYRLPAGVENLTLIGSGNISATGNELDNILIGNSGNNILRGGLGRDTFEFVTDPSAQINPDPIADFLSGVDRIGLSAAIYTTLAPGPIAADQFCIGKAAKDANDRIIYDPGTWNLYYDSDGTGSAAPIAIATIFQSTIAVSDIFVF